MRKLIITIFCSLFSVYAECQETPRYISELYNRLYTSMSNGTVIKPQIKIKDDLNFENSEKQVATYSPLNKTITIGLSFIELTRRFGKDSTNARAHVLSHELAHLFLNHGYVSVIGTGFASKEFNKEFKKTKEALDDKLGEMEADQWAFFYAYIAGYNTNRIAPVLLDSIYKYYNLNDKSLSQYPPLSERKRYASSASVKMKSMCEAFDFANIAAIHGDFNLSIEIYNAIIQEGFKSREIVSNLGTTYLLKAISLMDTTKIDFILPLQIDMDTRMKQEGERGLNNEDEIEELISRAIDLFKQSTTIDPEYAIGYFNLSMAYWLHNESKDSEYFLEKAKNKTPLNQQNRIKLFEAIIKLHMPEKNDKEIGLSSIQRLNNEGYTLAKANLNLLNKSSTSIKKTVPNWIFEISKTKLPENFQDARNILDSTFQKDKYRTLTCKEVNGDITYRKWKYINEESYIAIQYIFKSDVNKPLAENEINNLFLYCQSIFESSNNVYLRFGDVILIINPQKNIKYQIIKKL
jgi:hypothetical protein